MGTKIFIKFLNVNETYMIKFKNILKKIRKKKVFKLIILKCLFTSIFKILMKSILLYTNKNNNTQLDTKNKN